jgi:hypothetical protein
MLFVDSIQSNPGNSEATGPTAIIQEKGMAENFQTS